MNRLIQMEAAAGFRLLISAAAHQPAGEISLRSLRRTRVFGSEISSSEPAASPVQICMLISAENQSQPAKQQPASSKYEYLELIFRLNFRYDPLDSARF